MVTAAFAALSFASPDEPEGLEPELPKNEENKPDDCFVSVSVGVGTIDESGPAPSPNHINAKHNRVRNNCTNAA